MKIAMLRKIRFFLSLTFWFSFNVDLNCDYIAKKKIKETRSFKLLRSQDISIKNKFLKVRVRLCPCNGWGVGISLRFVPG